MNQTLTEQIETSSKTLEEQKTEIDEMKDKLPPLAEQNESLMRLEEA